MPLLKPPKPPMVNLCRTVALPNYIFSRIKVPLDFKLSPLMTFWRTQRLPGLQWVSICIFYLHPSAYQKEGMQREAKAWLKQMKKINLQKELSDNAYEETLNSVGKSDLAITLA